MYYVVKLYAKYRFPFLHLGTRVSVDCGTYTNITKAEERQKNCYNILKNKKIKYLYLKIKYSKIKIEIEKTIDN